MGKIRQGVYGALSGKTGNLIGASWRGIPYLRIMPASVANPRTPGQVNQRAKFRAVVAFVQAQAAMISIGYRAYASGKTAANAAVSYLLKTAITGTAPNFTVDYATALLSRGKLVKPAGQAVTATGLDASVTWNNNSSEGNALPDDTAMLVAYNPTRLESFILLEDTATRSEASLDFTIPAHFSGEEVKVYLAFRSADKRLISDSVFVGSLTVA